MSSTTGLQNLLVNTFRPVYSYNAAATLYTVKLDLSNVNTYYGNNVDVLWANVGDSASNVYVGKLAGNDPTVTTKKCVNNTAVGYGAGSNISNVANCVFLGFYAGQQAQDASAVIAIGSNAGGNGLSNIYIGNGTKAIGSNNILLGHDICLGTVSYTMRVGAQGTTTIAADLSKTWVGVGGALSPASAYTKFDVSGDSYFLGNVGVNITPGTRTLDVNGNFRVQDASSNLFEFSNGLARANNGYTSSYGESTVGPGGINTLGTLRQGLMMVSVQGQGGDSSGNYASRMIFVPDKTGVTSPVSLEAIQLGYAYIDYLGSNIRVSNSDIATRTFNYSITQFPVAA